MIEKDKLFAAVYANPDDDGPRSVLADLLQEQGDPRGEFIALQLARGRGGKKTRRESQLLKPNLRTWLGPLLSAIPNKGLVYERGFVAKCLLHHHRESTLPYLVHREWATVEEVSFGVWKGSTQPLADALPALRALSDLEWGDSIPSHPKLERVGLKFFNDENVDHLLSLDVPALRLLTVRHCHAEIPAIKRLQKSPLAKQLGLSLDINEDEADWIALMSNRKLPRAGVSMYGSPWRLWFEGDRITAEYWWADLYSTAGAALAAMLKHVPKPERWHVTIGRDVTIPRGLSTTLSKFKSHVVEPAEKFEKKSK